MTAKLKRFGKEGAMPSSLHKRPQEEGGLASGMPTSVTRSSTRIVIADVHSVFRYGLRQLLESESDFQVIGEASSGSEALKLARLLKPDLILLGLPLGEGEGLEVLAELVAASSTVRI